MKRLWKILFNPLVLSTVMLCSGTASAEAQLFRHLFGNKETVSKPKTEKPVKAKVDKAAEKEKKQKAEMLNMQAAQTEPQKHSSSGHPKNQTDLDDLSFTEMLNSVPLDAKSSELIQKFQDKEGRNRLHNKEYNAKNGSTVETFRNKEVLLITIPAGKLFAPNDTELSAGAAELLNPIKRYLSEPDMYRVLLVMHTDNTGSEAYRENLTVERANSVFDWFADQGVDTHYLFSYAFGDDMPLVENNSIVNREKNRRLEIYLVPGEKMLEQAKKGRIVF